MAKQSQEDYRPRGASQVENRQVSGQASIPDPSNSQTVSVTFDEPFASTPMVVALASDDGVTNGVEYSSVSKTGFTIKTARTDSTAVEVGWVVTGER